MELIFSSGVLTFLLLVGAFVDFLVNPPLRQGRYHGEECSVEPKRSVAAQRSPDLDSEYDRAA